MKVEVNSAAFADAVAWTSRVIPVRPTDAILTGIMLTTSQGTLELSAFDYEISAKHHIEATIEEDGNILVLGKLLAEIAKSLPAETTTLETIDNKLQVTSGSASFSLQLMPTDSYPELPAFPAELGSIASDTFANAVAQASVATAREESRIVLTGIKMDFKGNFVTLTATDRYRLSRVTFEWAAHNADVETSALIRGNTLKDLARSMNGDKHVIIGFDPEQRTIMGFENAGKISSVQLIDGEFPSIDKLFDNQYQTHIVINRKMLIDAIKRVSLVADRNASLRLEFKQNQLTISAGNTDEAHAQESLPINLDGEESIVAFNPTYLREGLQAINEDYVHIKMISAVKPVEFNGQSEEDGDPSEAYRYLLVPMRL